MPRVSKKEAKHTYRVVRHAVIKAVATKYGFKMGKAAINALTKTDPIYKAIRVEMTKSALKPEKEFFHGLESYIRHYNIKGEGADVVRAYLGNKAIGIAKRTEEILSEGKDSGTVKVGDLKGAIYFFHIPEGVDDPCKKASDTILEIEKRRSKGQLGMLSAAISGSLDLIKKE